MYLLCDVNSMYASCEQLFRPDLKGKPVIVLSNNDGCIVAANRQAKMLGIKAGAPYFQAKNLIQRYQIACFSSNYALYGDMSARVMTTLEALAPKLEIYSIDEAFLNITGIDACEPFLAFGQRVRATVAQQTGLICGIGIAQTRTLAKLANHAAKTWPATGGVVELSNPQRQRKLMALLPVKQVWGIGYRLSAKLNAMGITTALKLADANIQLIKRTFGVVVERTVRELNGIPSITIDSLPAKQQIICSRSFGEPITQLQDMRQAICQYAERAAERLRQQHQYCRHINVFLRTSPHANQPYYANNANHVLMLGTQDTRDIIAAAMKALEKIWRNGYRYQKAGVILNDFCHRPGQIDMFDETPPRPNSEHLMKVVDRINTTGMGKIWFAGQGIEQGWKMKRELLSPAYTTDWRAIPKAKI
ncbi:translesion error-prone DNA polymerase V subunit UmuC [Serratia sp. DD3]|uniref:translesion error-prone DNA polymerase V subunit UmuC n=1 Tax=Serratia sp. DD3 TaxID=1410619 RepID=UPI0003C4FDB0|nr:translesion error-prone DNA polymerase V subunit UmuC [Serratia sp. DD3]KEY57114.1 DNA polymerase IV [Serratia sp. DD3]